MDQHVNQWLQTKCQIFNYIVHEYWTRNVAGNVNSHCDWPKYKQSINKLIDIKNYRCKIIPAIMMKKKKNCKHMKRCVEGKIYKNKKINLFMC